MPLPQMILLGVFFTLVGACVGSFLNVVIWRLPYRGREVLYLQTRGKMTLSWPPSHCPMCDAPIAWYQNIPILSYVFLRGKCAQCRAPIPIRYPLVELATALLWGGFFLACFVAHLQGPICWIENGGNPVRDLLTDWPPYVWHLLFASALLAASAIDADLFIIPLAITWFLVILGLVGAPLLGPPLTGSFAIVPDLSVIFPHFTAHGRNLVFPVAGAAVGLLLANILLMLGILPRSFPWELEGGEGKSPAPADDDSAKKKSAAPEKTEADEPLAPPPRLTRFWPSVIAALATVILIAALWASAQTHAAGYAAVFGAIFVFLLGVLPRDAGQIDVTDEVVDEISGPGVRFEILKEALFVAIPVACAIAASWLPFDPPTAPWLMRLLGAVLGMLVGGGAIWALRIFGSLGFNKQAMGLGDVHLMAGVGAVLGAPLALMTIPLSAGIALIWAAILKIQGKPNVLPYGPWLSVAAIASLLIGNPLLCWYLKMFMN